MTAINDWVEGWIRLMDGAFKRCETVLKDGKSISGAYKLKEDPVEFAVDVLDFRPFPYQEDLLNDASKRICACMGRQTGKSTTMASKAIHFAATRKKKRILIVSATLRQSMLMFEKILNYIDSSSLVDSVKKRTGTQVLFTNGSSIIALPCGDDGATLRGFTADVIILDEASFMPEEVITNVVMPMISTTNGYCWMLSTPWDRNHIFYRVFNDPTWSHYHLPSSVNPLINHAFLEEQRELIGEERFAMEYLAEFIDDNKSYFTVSLIRQCVNEKIDLKLEGELFAGYDPGGKDSYAAFVVVRRIDDKLYLVHKKAEKGELYTQFSVEIADLNRKHPFKFMFDATGLGGPVEEHLKELGIDAEGIRFTDRNKEELLSNLKLLMEEKKLVLPDDSELHYSLNAIEFERTRTGAFKFYKRSGTYDDLGYALALACFAAKQDGGKGVVVKI
jgi:phage FluMu gp28-like protein